MTIRRPQHLLIVVAFLAGPATALSEEPPAKLDFNRDVRPIIADACYSCHGPDEAERKAGLRLDLAEEALAELASGSRAIVPGQPDESELVFRVEELDPSVHMPPPDSGKSITADQAALLRRWIEEGAEFERHWAFVPPPNHAPPAVSDESWPRNEIDRFIMARLDLEGLKPEPEADRATLIRRLALDLTGLPPTPEEVDGFVSDGSPDAYEQLVDRLLRSPRFGEHMARYWLDAARYGDTHGLHLDNYREIWPWRDWVIEAFNANKPFDDFIVEQLAGDLLPDPTLDQLIATGFNRNHVSTSEGGSIEEEVYVRNVVDQVDTNGTVFLGLTIGCARCHDHKYDPISQKDYYSLFAYFNSIDGSALDGNAKNWAPIVKVPSAEQAGQLADLDRRIGELEGRLNVSVSEAVAAFNLSIEEGEPEFVHREDFVWVDDAGPPGAELSSQTNEGGTWPFVDGPEHPVFRGKASLMLKSEGQAQHVATGAKPSLRVGPGDRLFAYVFLDPIHPPREVMLQWNSGEWKHRAYWGENLVDFGKDGTSERVHMGPLPPTGEWVRLEVAADKVGLSKDATIQGIAFTQHGGRTYFDGAGIATFTPQDGASYNTLTSYIRAVRAGLPAPDEIKVIANLERKAREKSQVERLLTHFVREVSTRDRHIQALKAELTAVRQDRQALDAQIPTTLVYRERKEPRPAYRLDRGEYDRRKEEVPRSVPGFLPPIPAGDPNDRLGFARWLVSPEHPLTARVTVNRIWQQIFGTGLVKTSEDFGLQGEPPSHPELLDWLAVRFREDGWDVKRTMKRLVMSATYRQAAAASPEKYARDPRNRLLSRGPRFRLDAEELRDQALYVSGLMVEITGGPSVKPPQPAGLWEAVGYTSSNTAKFQADTGPENVYRRSLYTFWKRTAAPPQMTTFDAPSREACTVRRERTNTPLQALELMNEPQMVEAARALANRTIREGGHSDEERAKWIFRRVMARQPERQELEVILASLSDHRAHYREDNAAARHLIEVAPGAELDAPAEDLAAWTMIANLLLNLDEVVTKG